VFITAVFAFVFSWKLESNQSNQSGYSINFQANGGAFLWVLFFTLAWASVSALLFALAGRERNLFALSTTRKPDLMRASLNFGYGLLIVVHIVCIYLTQSRGPWLGLGGGLVAFAVGM